MKSKYIYSPSFWDAVRAVSVIPAEAGIQRKMIPFITLSWHTSRVLLSFEKGVKPGGKRPDPLLQIPGDDGKERYDPTYLQTYKPSGSYLPMTPGSSQSKISTHKGYTDYLCARTSLNRNDTDTHEPTNLRTLYDPSLPGSYEPSNILRL